MEDYAQEAAARADKLSDVLDCLRSQLVILDELGHHVAAARLSQALDSLESDIATLQVGRTHGGDMA